jgi:hypothetical protein
MLTTAFGLIVGIPALYFYNYFVAKVNRFVFEIENSAEEFMSLMKTGQFEDDGSMPEKKAERKSSPTRTVFADDEFFEPKDE